MANPITQIVLSAVDRTKAAFASVKGGFESLRASAGGLKSLLAGIGVGLTFAGVVGAFKRAADAMDDAYKSAQKIGTSVENFSALSYAAGQSGVPVETLEKSLLKLSRTMDDARTGTGKAAETFARLQIDPKQFADPADALLVIAERFQQLPDGATKAALAQELFGRTGAELIPLLNQGAAGIRELTTEAKELGRVFETEAAAAAEQFNDNLDKLKTAGEGLVVNALTPMLPGLTEVTRLMADAAKEGGILSAIWAGLKLAAGDFLTNESLKPTYRLAEAQKQLNALRADGFDEDHRRIVQLKQYIPLLTVLADEEKRAADAKSDASEKAKQAGKDSMLAMEARKDEVASFKESVNEQVKDAERLQSALQTAFSASIKSEESYLRQAKKLRAEASGSGTAGTDPESQAKATLDATIAAMKLQREAGTASLETVQDQAEALRNMAGQITDVAKAEDYRRQANLAEAKALERAAAEEKARYQGLAEQQARSVSESETLKAALDGIGKEVSVDIKMNGLDKAIAGLERYAHLIDAIKAKGPIDATAAGTSGAGMTDSLRTAALQHGRRR